jgi:quercetin dioxygenase-like cupin family protein
MGTTAMRELAALERREIWDGVMARVVEGERMTLAVIEIRAGKRVPEHKHDNEQIGFVIEGTLVFRIGDETRELGPGGTWRILSNVPHQVEAGPRGAIVAEAYAPVRADWSELPAQGPATPVWPLP